MHKSTIPPSNIEQVVVQGYSHRNAKLAAKSAASDQLYLDSVAVFDEAKRKNIELKAILAEIDLEDNQSSLH